MNETKEKKKFNEQLNISYVPDSTPRPDTRYVIQHCLSSIFLYGLALTIFLFNPWYANFVTHGNARTALIFMYITYVVLAPIIYLSFKPKHLINSKSILILGYFRRLFTEGIRSLPEWTKGEKTAIIPTYREQQAILLFMVKFFFGPFMLEWVFENIDLVRAGISTIGTIMSVRTDSLLASPNFRDSIFVLIIQIFMLVDLSLYAAGYFWEASFLRNRVKTVESTVFGIFICLVCYPPLNQVTGTVFINVSTYTSAFYGDSSTWITWAFRIPAIIFLYIYASASVALFTKASNLTNRGIVSIWPYSMVRHPAYMGKTTFWWLTGIPMFFYHGGDLKSHIMYIVIGILGLMGWTLIYYLRAITEERHLSKDPDYVEYMKKVKYKWIPGLF